MIGEIIKALAEAVWSFISFFVEAGIELIEPIVKLLLLPVSIPLAVFLFVLPYGSR